MALVEATEANTGKEVEATIADCAYGGGANRKEFDDAGRPLVTKVPAANDPFHKSHFKIDLDNHCITCPAGHTINEFEEVSAGKGQPRVKRFVFPLKVCQECPHKDQCLRSKEKDGSRTVTLHPQEDLLQKARAYQDTPEFRQHMRDRQQAEHGFAHLMQYGARQARYFGLAKVKLQSVVTAALLNFLIVFSFSQNPTALEEAISIGGQECPPVPGQSWDRDEDLGAISQAACRQAGEKKQGTLQPDGVRGAPPLAAPPTQGGPQ